MKRVTFEHAKELYNHLDRIESDLELVDSADFLKIVVDTEGTFRQTEIRSMTKNHIKRTLTKELEAMKESIKNEIKEL